jgi:Zn-dependent protease with chaperone function
LGAFLLLTNWQAINFFSLKQDVELGTESAKAAERSFVLVRDAGLNRHLRSISQRLIRTAALPPLTYQARIVNSKEVQSLGFPGGAIYVYRGLIDIASNDDELAAILAHEIGHIAARHGTAQLSRQLVVQAPIAIAAGLPATEAWKEQIARLGIALGADAPFLRYSRDQELEAGLTAVRLLADGPYDPNALRSLREKIGEMQTIEGARPPAFVFNHPQSESISAEIEAEIHKVSAGRVYRARATQEFRTFRAALKKVAYPASAKEPPDEFGEGLLSNTFTNEFYRLSYPSGWQLTKTGTNGAIITPLDGAQPSRSGDEITRGVIVDLFDVVVPDRTLTIEQATNRLIVFLRQRNQSLRVVPGAQSQLLVGEEPGLRTVLLDCVERNRTAARGRDVCTSSASEVIWVVTRLYYQSLFYMVLVAPEDEFSTYQHIFEQIIRSARLR